MCTFCKGRGNTKFLKVTMDDNIKKALKVLKSNALIDNYNLKHVVTI
jgi:hypothetical protein